VNRLVISLLLASACAGDNHDPAAGPDGGTGSGSGSQSATCDPQINPLRPGSPVTVNSTQTGGNPQRDYCITVPSGSTQLRLDLTGGSCGQFACAGDDVELYLERGAAPDAFDPDGSTTAWTYTPDPNGFGMYVKAAQAGAWYLGIIDDQNTLGYSGVAMKVSFP
jgi:hypothetical protein